VKRLPKSRVRSRVSPHIGPISKSVGKRYAWDSNIGKFQSTPLQDKIYTFPRTWDFGEITKDEKHPGPPYRTGGPFRNLKVTSVKPSGFQGYGTFISKPPGHPVWTWEKYVGGFSPPSEVAMGGFSGSPELLLSVNSPLFPGISNTDRDRAWKLSKPKLERVNSFVSIAELRDLPRMLKATARTFKELWERRGRELFDNAPDTFLSHEFGWRPFLRDLSNMIELVHSAEEAMEKVKSRNGKPTRRHVTITGNRIEVEVPDKADPTKTRKKVIRVDPIVSSTMVASGTGNQCLPSSLPTTYFDGSPTWELWEIKEDLLIASSKWTYYNPFFDASVSGYETTLSGIRRYLTLFGLRATPSNIWRATPWTWLIDWFSNLGDLIDQMSDYAVDEVVCWYMFVTRIQKVTRRFVQILPFKDPGPLSLVWEKIYSSKERVNNMSPYGFHLAWDDLTPRQLMILAALGDKGWRSMD
jgi:hypothetical protein